MKKSNSRILCLFVLFIIAFSLFSLNKLNISANAGNEGGITGTTMTLTSDATVRKEANDNAEAVIELSAGDSIFVVKEENGWYQIYYKGEYAYVKVEDGGQSIADIAIDSTEELDKEFTQKEQMNTTYVESYLKQQQRARSALVWKIIIAVLVVAIIVTSVVIGIRSSKNKKGIEESKDIKES